MDADVRHVWTRPRRDLSNFARSAACPNCSTPST
jgi:hypothetical protein